MDYLFRGERILRDWLRLEMFWSGAVAREMPDPELYPAFPQERASRKDLDRN